MAKTNHTDDKNEALRKRRCLNPRPEKVNDELFESGGFFDSLDLLQVKYEMIRRASAEGKPVKHAAAEFGFSRPAFYEARDRFQEEGLAGLIPRKRGPRGGHKLTDKVVDFISEAMAQDPEVGIDGLVDLVRARFALEVHRRSLERALKRRKKNS